VEAVDRLFKAESFKRGRVMDKTAQKIAKTNSSAPSTPGDGAVKRMI